MFYYYGRKKRLAGLYPHPAHQVVIEPFAGSAAYSLFGSRWTHKVILIEKDPQVAALWRWLIDEATEADIRAFPDPVEGGITTDFLHILHMASKRWFTYNKVTATPFLMDAWRASKTYMAANVYKVKHWQIIEGDYTEAPDIEATWFIDPPYQGEPGTGYRHGSDLIDYESLARWVEARKGAVIACEGVGATWMPFERLCTVFAHAGKEHEELVYLRGLTTNPIGDLFG
jgi:16S rRNA G966 N2-methylase RsmD